MEVRKKYLIVIDKFLQKHTVTIVLSVMCIVFAYLAFKPVKTETVKIPLIVEVPVPGIQATFPPVEMPKPKKLKPRPKLVEEFKEATDQEKDSLYADAVTERVYEEIFTDSVQSVTVTSNVQGKLLKQAVSYDIFPRTVTLDTVVEAEVPKKIGILLGPSIGIPMNQNVNDMPVQINAGLQTIKGNIIMGSYDINNKVVMAGYLFKF